MKGQLRVHRKLINNHSNNISLSLSLFPTLSPLASSFLKGGDGLGLCADVTQASEAKRVLDETIAAFGHVDILINAGVHNAQPNGFGKMTEEYWKSSIDTNLHAQVGRRSDDHAGHVCRGNLASFESAFIALRNASSFVS